MNKSTQIIVKFFLIFTISLNIKCATISTAGMQAVPVLTNPADAKISIHDSNNLLIFEGNSPCMIILKKEKMINSRLTISKPGYKSIEIKIGKRIDSCFYGNICLGIIPGIVDIVNGNWIEGNIDGINIKLEELKTVQNFGNKTFIILSHRGSKDPEYSLSFKTDMDDCSIILENIN